MPNYNTYESFSEISVGDIIAYTNKDGKRIIGQVIIRWGKYANPQLEICDDESTSGNYHPVSDYTKCKVLERF